MDTRRYRQVVYGEAQDVAAGILRGGLRCASWPYGCAVRIRNRLYDWGCKRVQRAAVPVISVGNITAGGTGKTPFVAYLANWFRQRELTPCLLSRGYHSGQDDVNDEKRVLDQLCPGVVHLQDPDRVASAARAIREHGAQILILDDGFQHRRLHRDLDLVLIDATDPWGAGALLPRGLLREPVSGLTRADLLIVTRCDLVDSPSLETVISRLRQICPQTPQVLVSYPPGQLRDVTGRRVPAESVMNERIAAFCGIGNPAGFQTTLQKIGLNPVWVEAFPDHHPYDADDIRKVTARAQNDGVTTLLTTQKDLVKLGPPTEIPIWAVEIDTRIDSGRDVLQQQLEQLPNRSGLATG